MGQLHAQSRGRGQFLVESLRRMLPQRNSGAVVAPAEEEGDAGCAIVDAALRWLGRGGEDVVDLGGNDAYNVGGALDAGEGVGLLGDEAAFGRHGNVSPLPWLLLLLL
mmetsp:Transcript_8828/g.18662  ORF Transcript_8828/g.18662 Transcript_8828/m.18662 type:complete len:108 (+) Transcript_8828:3390-3713(+)